MKTPVVAALLLCASLASPARAQPRADVQSPRWYGHFIGDMLQQRIALRGADGRPLVPESLPEAGRVDAWLERRAARIDPGGWLVIDYQLVNSPQQARRVSLPSLRLTGRGSGEAIDVPAWPLSIAPLAADDLAAPAPLQPARPAPQRDVTAALLGVQRSALALGATLLLWAALVAGWRWRDATHRPFARATRELRRLPAEAPEAWRALHRAFDHCAGRSLHRGQLGPLFDAAPWLGPLRPQIDRFYGDSATLFYGGVPPSDPALPHTLLRQLHRLERRQ